MMTEVEIKTTSEQTRQRLLVAAREVFSQHSFQGATAPMPMLRRLIIILEARMDCLPKH